MLALITCVVSVQTQRPPRAGVNETAGVCLLQPPHFCVYLILYGK